MTPCVAARRTMTLTSYDQFVLVYQLARDPPRRTRFSQRATVSQTLSRFRLHLGEPLVSRGPSVMTLTARDPQLLDHRLAGGRTRRRGPQPRSAPRPAPPSSFAVVTTSSESPRASFDPLTQTFGHEFSGQ